MRKIEYYAEPKYGTVRNYVVDASIAETLRVLTGRVTLTDMDIKCLEFLGHKVKRIKK